MNEPWADIKAKPRDRGKSEWIGADPGIGRLVGAVPRIGRLIRSSPGIGRLIGVGLGIGRWIGAGLGENQSIKEAPEKSKLIGASPRIGGWIKTGPGNISSRISNQGKVYDNKADPVPVPGQEKDIRGVAPRSILMRDKRKTVGVVQGTELCLIIVILNLE